MGFDSFFNYLPEVGVSGVVVFAFFILSDSVEGMEECKTKEMLLTLT